MESTSSQSPARRSPSSTHPPAPPSARVQVHAARPSNAADLPSLPQNAPDFSLDELKDAIAVSQKAFESWRHSTPAARAAVLQKWKQLCIENEADLALLITVENGKPLHEAKGEVNP